MENTRGGNANTGLRAHVHRESEGLISACAAFSLHFSPSHSPFPPSLRKRVPLLSATPLRYHPLFSSTPFVPLLIAFAPFRPSFFPSSPVFLLVCSRFPFSSLDFPSLSPRRIRIFLLPRSFSHQAILSIAFSPSFSCLSVSFTPFRYAPLIVRACHASPR